MTTHSKRPVDFYERANAVFEQEVAVLRATAASNHADVERAIWQAGMEVMRNLYQGWLNQVSAVEKQLADMHPKPEGVQEIRTFGRRLESIFGRVRVPRLGYRKQEDNQSEFPLDKILNLPSQIYSLPVRERVADEARRGSFEQASCTVDKTTGAHVPHRQAEKLAGQAAQDFDAFYEQKAANDSVSPEALELVSVDGKGVTMRKEGLRDATRKAKQEVEAAKVRGDPMAQKKTRKYDKRMAVVSANWEQVPKVRSAEDILAGLDGDKSERTKLPRPQNKRVRASVEKTLAQGIEEAFDELDRRDPEHKRKVGVLLDGGEDQLAMVKKEADKRARSLVIILDVIHVLHYLWMAGYALCDKDDVKTEAFTREFLRRLLTGSASYVASTIRRMATMQQLDGTARESVDTCCGYLLKYQEYLRYNEYLAQGFPIASGIIEGTCRYLIQDRLGITGARWNVPGAEAVLRLRAIHSSGDWEEYIAFHERQESSRNDQIVDKKAA